MGAETLIVDFVNFPGGYYTLEREDKGEIKSLYKLYMECEDLTEWSFADKYLLGWEHWEKLLGNAKVLKQVELWRRDLEQKLKSRAFQEIMLEAQEGGKNAFEANKILLNGKWKEQIKVDTSKRGRPSKAEIDSKTQAILDQNKSLEETYKRLGLDS